MNLIPRINRTIIVPLLISSLLFSNVPIALGDRPSCESCGAEFSVGDVPRSVLIRVKLIGAIARSGIFNIPRGTDLLSLLANAGGVLPTANGEVLIKRYNGKAFTMSEYDLEDLVKSSKTLSPEVKQDDVIYIPHSKPIVSDNAFKIMSLITGIAGVITTVYLLSSRFSGN